MKNIAPNIFNQNKKIRDLSNVSKTLEKAWKDLIRSIEKDNTLGAKIKRQYKA